MNHTSACVWRMPNWQVRSAETNQVSLRRLDLCECVTRRRVNQLGMQAAVTGSSETLSEGDFGLSASTRDCQERLTEAEVCHRTGRMDEDFGNLFESSMTIEGPYTTRSNR